MTDDMEKLSNVLNKWTSLDEFKYIPTAQIPVIKMKVNLEKLRDQESSLDSKVALPEDSKILSLLDSVIHFIKPKEL